MQKIRFVCHAVRWTDKVNGNTYHSVRVTRCKDGATVNSSMQYGYGEQYRQTALNLMGNVRWLPVAYRGKDSYLYERENNYPIQWIVTDGLKRDCIANTMK